MTTTPKLACLDAGPDCSGPVEYRMPLAAPRRAFPRCEAHWEKRLHFDEAINCRYPQMAPRDSAPRDAGERCRLTEGQGDRDTKPRERRVTTSSRLTTPLVVN
jgi:hypothetical protein